MKLQNKNEIDLFKSIYWYDIYDWYLLIDMMWYWYDMNKMCLITCTTDIYVSHKRWIFISSWYATACVYSEPLFILLYSSQFKCLWVFVIKLQLEEHRECAVLNLKLIYLVCYFHHHWQLSVVEIYWITISVITTKKWEK